VNVLSAIHAETWVSLAQSVGFMVLVVVLVRVRPWRWLAPFLRSGRRG